MARRRLSPEEFLLKRVLARAQELAEQVREIAERVHLEAKEAHRLTQIARQHAARGRELSEAGRAEARAVIDSVKWNVDTAGNARRGRSGEDGS
jgi:hypothetical protein